MAPLFKSSFWIVFREPRCTSRLCFYNDNSPMHYILKTPFIASGLEDTVVGEAVHCLRAECFCEMRIANASDVQESE